MIESISHITFIVKDVKRSADLFRSGSIEQHLKCLDDLSSNDLNWCLIESANSLYFLATHVLGNVEENIIVDRHAAEQMGKRNSLATYYL
jgi:hypothetical protein